MLLEKGKVIRDLREKGDMLKELEAYFVGWKLDGGATGVRDQEW